jgi:dihydropteroate synthase
MKPEVARVALELGACMINDVAAASATPGMLGLVADSGAAYICMHMQGEPRTMQKSPKYQNVVRDVKKFLAERLNFFAETGIAREQLVTDPGIGFGKTSGHNLQLLAHLESFTELGRPVLVGASRKSFIGGCHGNSSDQRLAGSLACACRAVQAGVNILRVHDVAATVQAVRTLEAIRSAHVKII